MSLVSDIGDFTNPAGEEEEEGCIWDGKEGKTGERKVERFEKAKVWPRKSNSCQTS